MTALNTIDTSIIVVYLLVTLGVGVMMTKKASKSLDHYYLGGRSLPWYMLGMAGTMGGYFLGAVVGLVFMSALEGETSHDDHASMQTP